MADIDLRQLGKLFDRKLLPLQRNDDVLKRGQAHTNRVLDTVARHLARIQDELTDARNDLGEVKKTQAGHSETLDRIERQGVQHTDRLDDHGQRIEELEVKTAHLPARP